MQNAEVILSMLSQKAANNSAYVFDRLYRNLFNLDMYMLAYRNIYVHEGDRVQGTDEGTMDGFRLKVVQETIALLRQETYHPQSVRRSSIQKQDGTFRAPSTPSFQDQIVQEVVRMLLQAIYEPIFKDSSHGFRASKSSHTALVQVKTTCKGANWVIEGDIKDFFEHIQSGKLRELLAKNISDGRFLNLIDKFLTAGYMQCKQGDTALTGIARGSIVSPILANIYLHQLDEYMEKICVQISTEIGSKSYQSLPSHDPFDQDYIKVKYIRYADDFVVMIIGSKRLAEQIRRDIKDFLEQELQLELNLEKTVITHLLSQRVRFLGYEITKTRADKQLPGDILESPARVANEAIQLLVPADVIREKLKPFVENGKAIHAKVRINLPLLDLIQQYNAEISGLYNYYCLATDVSTKIGKFKYYHYSSLVKTIARKEKSSVTQVISKYGVDVKRKQGTGTRKIVGIAYTTQEGPKILTYFNDPLKKQDQAWHGSDHMPEMLYFNPCGTAQTEYQERY
jgi:group II intron reverse transcriptase/maturase